MPDSTIYNNEKPLGLMDPALREELEAHSEAGGKVERYNGKRGWLCIELSWNDLVTYRAVEEPVVMTLWGFHNGGQGWEFEEYPDPSYNTHKITGVIEPIVEKNDD